jgi:hypothetical protein
MAIRLLKSAEPLAASTSHSTLSWEGEVVTVTACHVSPAGRYLQAVLVRVRSSVPTRDTRRATWGKKWGKAPHRFQPIST